MISYIKGTLEEVFKDMVVVESAGIGYNIFVPLSVTASLPKTGEQIQIFTYFQVREDAMNLYGFLNRRDLSMFKMLIGVNGIGPKGALGLLSALSPDQLRMAIISGDAKTISTAPGIGAKTAQRVIIDLKDKIGLDDLMPDAFDGTGIDGTYSDIPAQKEAMEALIALGYSQSEASRAVRGVGKDGNMTAGELLKASLKFLSSR